MPAFTHRVRLHFRSLSLTDVPFHNILRSAESVYAQYGIKLEFASGLSLGLSKQEAARLEKIDGECKWTITDGELRDVQKLGDALFFTDVTVYYVNRFTSGLLGCGGYIPGRPACIVAANASRWDTAHELGHVLLGSNFSPVHSTDLNNLMHATASSYAKTPILTDQQVAQIKKSPCCLPLA